MALCAAMLPVSTASAQWEDPNEVVAEDNQYIVVQTPGDPGNPGNPGSNPNGWAPGIYFAQSCYYREFERTSDSYMVANGGFAELVDSGTWDSYNDRESHDEKTAELGAPTFYVRVCQAVLVVNGVATPVGLTQYSGGAWVWPGEPMPGIAPGWTIAQLLLAARNNITYPTWTLETNPGAAGVVGLPTYFGVPTSAQGARTASAQIGGSPTISATATPVSLSIRTGDGNVIRCPGLGAVGEECQHIYSRSSTADGVYTVQSWIEYRITYSVPGVPAVGYFGPVSTIDYPVEEIQAVNG